MSERTVGGTLFAGPSAQQNHYLSVTNGVDNVLELRNLDPTHYSAMRFTLSEATTSGQAQGAVPNSTGTEPAKLKAPPNAADCHMHIYDPRFAESNPRPGLNPKNATVSDYRLLQKRTGTTRVVVVVRF